MSPEVDSTPLRNHSAVPEAGPCGLPLFDKGRFAGLIGEKSGAPVGCPQGSVFPILAMGQEHLARRSKAPLRVRDPTLVRQRIGFHTVTRQDDRASHDPPLKMLMSRAVLVICLVIQIGRASCR